MVAKEPNFRAPPGLDKPTRSTLRPDAQPYYPTNQNAINDEGEMELWEQFLEKKQAKVSMSKNSAEGLIRAGADGSFTSRYTNMLGDSSRPRRQKDENVPRDFDILKSWRNAAPKVNPLRFVDDEQRSKKRKTPTPLKKQILAQRQGDTPNPLWTKFADHMQRHKEGTTPPSSEKVAQDDLQGTSDIVPYGLADRCYLSDTEDKSKAHRHIETSHGLIRDYVDTSVTPELETAVTACLYRLRQLKMQDLGIGVKASRYAIGLREVNRALQHKRVAALIIAPDVEETSGGALEHTIASLKNKGEEDKVPVIFALSRRQLGAAIQKNVAVSVFAILETRGAEEAFEQMLAEAKRARDVGA
jgi:ribosomal protein L7Ae-like RNA K-turn-binding protein